MILEVLSMALFCGVLIFANYAERRKRYWLAVGILEYLGLGSVIAVGILYLETAPKLGVCITVSGLLSILLLFREIRERLSSVMEIDPESKLHTLSLILFILLVGAFSGILLSVETTRISTLRVGVEDVVIQDVGFVFLSLFGVGWLTRRSIRETIRRLGISSLGPKGFLSSAGFVGLMFLVSVFASLLLPSSGEDATVKVLGGVSILSAVVISISAGLGEELLFRGAMQPRFGILPSAFLFSLVHLQYPHPVQLFSLFLLGVILGYERKRINTTASIVSHIAYDILSFLSMI